MRLAKNRIGFYIAVGVCNIMTWGMFTTLNMPRTDAVAVSNTPVHTPVVFSTFTATVGTPVRVVVPTLGIDEQVHQGIFDPVSQEWTLSDEVAYFAVGSTPANDSNGTTIIYGHAKPAMFEPLRNVSPGTIVEVYTDNGKIFSYTYSSMKEVDPTDTSVFKDTGPPTVVLQTCSGPWDQYRALYSFDFVGMRSA